jgi:hypothetical protein
MLALRINKDALSPVDVIFSVEPGKEGPGTAYNNNYIEWQDDKCGFRITAYIALTQNPKYQKIKASFL